MVQEVETEPTDWGKQYATPQEARRAIESLGSADYAKLNLIARSFARSRLQGTVVEPADLLHDAIMKTLDGRRRWNKSVTIIKHLDRIMESDSGHIVEHRVAYGPEPLPEGELGPADQLPDPITRLSAVEEQLETLFDLFADDKTALDLLFLKSQGLSASDIKRKLGIGKTQYETATKRIRRHLAQCLSKGGQ